MVFQILLTVAPSQPGTAQSFAGWVELRPTLEGKVPLKTSSF